MGYVFFFSLISRIDFNQACSYILCVFFVKVHLPRRSQPQQERLNLVTRLSASLLTPWLFPDKCCCPLDSTSLHSRVMANYQEAVCWKDAARNCICLQAAIGSKHMLWNKLPSKDEAHSQTRVAFRVLCECRKMSKPSLTWDWGFIYLFV